MTERHESTAHERLILALNDPNHLFTADQGNDAQVVLLAALAASARASPTAS